MESLLAILPKWPLALLASAFMIARFENQRWVRARIRGLRGSSAQFGAIIDLTRSVALLFTFSFLIAYGYEFGWLKAFVLFGMMCVVVFFYMLISTAALVWITGAGESIIIWMLGTLVVWPLMYFLGRQVSWFGWR